MISNLEYYKVFYYVAELGGGEIKNSLYVIFFLLHSL